MRKIRLFLSSPGDCRDERDEVERVADRLERDPLLRSEFQLQVIRWDWSEGGVAMPATMSPQEAVDRGLPYPESCELFVGVFRGRMGTPLPRERFAKPDGSAYLSGSEYEFVNAYEVAQRLGGESPCIFLYRGPVSPPDMGSEQLERLERFFSGEPFHDREGALTGGLKEFSSTEDFARQLENDLRQWLAMQAPWLSQSFGAWLSARARIFEADAGPRYTPEAHIETTEASDFDWLLRRPVAFKELDDAYAALWKRIPSGRCSWRSLKNHLRDVEQYFRQVRFHEGMDLQYLRTTNRACVTRLDRRLQAIERLDAYLRKRTQDRESEAEERIKAHRRIGYATREALDDCESLIARRARIHTQPVMLLTGPPGQGKTHSLVDQVRRTVAEGGIAIGVLGHQLRHGGNLWQEIFDHLNVTQDATPERLLGWIDAEARRRGCMALLAIDALNETKNRTRWREQLPGMLDLLSLYPNIAVVLAVRDEYLYTTLPSYPRGSMPWTRVRHTGFAGVEAAALAKYFATFGLQAPVSPPVSPELSNPLYLKLLCTSMQGRGNVSGTLPSWSVVFRDLCAKLDDDLRTALGDAVPATRREIVRRVLGKLAGRMLGSGVLIPRGEAEAEATKVVFGIGVEIVDFLVGAGVLLTFPDSDDDDDMLSFGYERLTDTFLAERLLDRMEKQGSLRTAGVRAAFAPGGELHRLLSMSAQSDDDTRPGLLSALALILPTRVRKELPALVPEGVAIDGAAVARAFVDSLLWRAQPKEFGGDSDQLHRWLTNASTQVFDTPTQKLAYLLRLSLIPEHPLGIDRFHSMLLPLGLADRDAAWTIYLPALWHDDRSVVSLLVNWAADQPVKGIRRNTAWPVMVVLGWLTAATASDLHERAARGLCRLVAACPDQALPLLEAFKEVDDPYVVEALLRAMLGVVEFIDERHVVGRIGMQVYRWQFEADSPGQNHLLIRHFARRVVEAAVEKAGLTLDLDLTSPPYKNGLALNEVPASPELDALAEKDDGFWRILHSCTVLDFYRYIIGENSGKIGFSPEPLPESVEPPRPWPRNDRGGRILVRTDVFDIDLAGRFVAWNCLRLGWTAERFADFDSGPDISHDRIHTGPYVERIGKKYQWIGWRTLQAFLADNYWVRPLRSEVRERYEDPVQLSEAVGDPLRWLSYGLAAPALSVSEHADLETRGLNGGAPPFPYQAHWPLPEPSAMEEWVRKDEDEPRVQKLLRTVSADCTEDEDLWLNPEGGWKLGWRSGCWASPNLHAEIWWLCSARLIGSADMPTLLRALRKRSVQKALRGIGRPDYPVDERASLRDWLVQSHPGSDPTDRHGNDPDERFPVPYQHLFWRIGQVGSFEGERPLTVVAPEIASAWRLHLDLDRGGYVRPDGRMVFRNTLLTGGDDAVYARADTLLELLQSEGLELVWLVRGERTALVDPDHTGCWTDIHGIVLLTASGIKMLWMNRDPRCRFT